MINTKLNNKVNKLEGLLTKGDMMKSIINIELAKKHNLPSNMSKMDFEQWHQLDGMISKKESLGWECESYKNQRFDIINRYYTKKV